MDVSMPKIDINIKNFLNKKAEKTKFIPRITLQRTQ